MKTNIIKFLPGQNLETRSICNHDCIFKAEVISRTEKTVTIKVDGKIKKLKAHTHENINNGNEFIFPYGRYSMAPVFQAG